MSDTEQQSFQAWLRGHFTFDSHDLAEITNFIAVPGLPDVDMPDVLSLLAEEDGVQQPSSAHGAYPQSQTSLDSTAAVTNSSMLWPTGQAVSAAPQQPTAGACLPPAGDADVTALADFQVESQLQSQAQQAGLHSSEQQLPAPPIQQGSPSGGSPVASQPSYQPHGHRTKHTRQPTAGKRSTGIQGASRRVSAAAAADASVQAGSVKKRKRKISDAQRAAHRRFRERRREQLATLEQEVEAKQAQLQALSLEHLALKAKARALDQLVASAGDGMAVLQQLKQLSISQVPQQQQQQQPRSVAKDRHQQQQQPLSVSTGDNRLPAISSAVSTGADSVNVTSSAGLQPRQPQQSSSDPETSSSSSPERRQQQQLEHEQLVRADSNRGSGNNTWGGNCSTGVTAGSLQHQLQTPASRAGAAGSIEYLEARLKTLLAVPTYGTVNEGDSMHVQDELEKLRTLLNSIVREVTQLLHQLGEETGQGSLIRPHTSPGDHLLYSAEQKWQQATASDLGSSLQQQGLAPNEASVAAATGNGDDVSASPAYVRLQALLAQCTMEFRRFLSVNRLSLYHADILNLETGSLGVPPPPGHWKRVAVMLKDKLPQQVLSDVCVARQLYSNAVSSITHQRHMLIQKLQRLLERDESVYRTLQVIVDLHGLHGEGAAILDAIDHNMRKDFALSGVYQFMMQKLMSPILSAELLVHSYPYLPDLDCILGDIVQMTEQVPALTALQELQLQQPNSMGGGEQQQPTQIRTSGYDIDQQQSFVAQTGQLQQQQRPGRSLHQQEIPAAVMQHFQTQTDATWQGQQAPLQQLPVEPWQHVQQQQQAGLDWLEQLPAISM